MNGRALFAGLLLALGGCVTEPLPYVVDGDAIPRPLGAEEGDPKVGEQLFAAREGGHCVLCHQVASLDAPFQGNLGPALDDVGARLTPGQIRLRIVDASRLNPATVMPPYYRASGLEQVGEAYGGKPALTAEEIEHLVAWLATLEDRNGSD